LSQSTLLTVRRRDQQTDGQTDRILIARPRLHSMQHGKKESKVKCEESKLSRPYNADLSFFALENRIKLHITRMIDKKWHQTQWLKYMTITTVPKRTTSAYFIKLPCNGKMLHFLQTHHYRVITDIQYTIIHTASMTFYYLVPQTADY